MSRKQKILVSILWSFLFVISAVLSYAWGLYQTVYVSPSPNPPSAITGTPTPTPDPLAPKNIVLLGYGGAGHDGGNLTDTIIVAHIRPRNREIILISIPRDAWIPLPVKNDKNEYYKVNHAYAIGGDDAKYPGKPAEYSGSSGAGNMAKYAVGQVTGLRIDNFVSINFSGFKTVVDYLGGINVQVPFSFVDEYYPIKGEEDNPCDKTDEEIELLTATMSGFLLEQQFTCRYEKLEFNKGRMHMDGETALKFVRSRHSNTQGGDFSRSVRQQAFIIALKDKLLSYSSVPRLIPVINTIARNILTDIDIASGLDLAKDQGLSDISIKTVSLSTDNVFIETFSSDRQYILVPKSGINDWASVHEYLQRELED